MTTSDTSRTVLGAADITRALTRISHEILESNKGPDGLVLLGIPTRGVTLADRIGAQLAAISGETVPVGALSETAKPGATSPPGWLKVGRGTKGWRNCERMLASRVATGTFCSLSQSRVRSSQCR